MSLISTQLVSIFREDFLALNGGLNYWNHFLKLWLKIRNGLVFYFDAGIILHCLCCDIWMDQSIIRPLSIDSPYVQFLQKSICWKSWWWIWGSVNSLPQWNSQDSLLWTSWCNILLPCSPDSAVSLGLLLSGIHHLSQPGYWNAFLFIFSSYSFTYELHPLIFFSYLLSTQKKKAPSLIKEGRKEK